QRIPMRGPDRCACAASGNATADPTSASTKSRRLTVAPDAQDSDIVAGQTCIGKGVITRQMRRKNEPMSAPTDRLPCRLQDTCGFACGKRRSCLVSGGLGSALQVF